ncbi:transporter [Rugamonas sp. CCM 8940]|uniref:transporter n=1 Tax=Rugamonas sp. CCM 8940 TaxID=2765359 RepID=UPI0018F67285|nr:transporter [Rugamonas sp. CCM 8940]MBJ7313750.1 transporter [Rugamonas sp. CCM 8940]
MHSTTSALILGATLLSQSVHAEDAPPVTPYRPSVSSPAQLPAPGQLELELGGLSSKSDGQRRNSLPFAFKLGFSEEWGVVLGGEAWVRARDDDGARVQGVGDTAFVLKRAFLVDSATAFGLELGAKAPTARDSIGSGRADYSVNGIFSRDLGKVHMDANFNLLRLGAVEEGSGRTQSGLSAAFSLPLSERWGAAAEWSGTRRGGAASTAQLLLAASYSPSKRLTFDFGLARGLNRASPDLSLFTGVVLPLARLWQ